MFLLGWEASEVIALRSIKLMQGGAASAAEAQLMVTEKLAAMAELQQRALTGSLGVHAHQATSRTVGHLRRKVKANRKRLRS